MLKLWKLIHVWEDYATVIINNNEHNISHVLLKDMWISGIITVNKEDININEFKTFIESL